MNPPTPQPAPTPINYLEAARLRATSAPITAKTPRPTPETDKAAKFSHTGMGGIDHYTVPADFARRLERERDEARAEIEAQKAITAGVREAYADLCRANSSLADGSIAALKELTEAREELTQVRENLYAVLDRNRDDITTPHLATVAANALTEARSECLEQARLNGKGGQREAKLLSEVAGLTARLATAEHQLAEQGATQTEADLRAQVQALTDAAKRDGEAFAHIDKKSGEDFARFRSALESIRSMPASERVFSAVLGIVSEALGPSMRKGGTP